MVGRYPEIEPYDHGMLDVGDGNRLYWETCGNPDGKPAVVLHGGPGAGCSTNLRRYFDPAAYRIVLFDQRQCGRSTPHAGAPTTDLSTNTTEHLLGDLETLRAHLGIDRWLVFGGSWGSILGLRYAERHPDRVGELVLMGVATGRRGETDLLTRGLAPLTPMPGPDSATPSRRPTATATSPTRTTSCCPTRIPRSGPRPHANGAPGRMRSRRCPTATRDSPTPTTGWR